MKSHLIGAALAAAGMSLACGSDPTPPPQGPTGPTEAPVTTAAPTAEGTAADDGKDPGKSQINISEEIRKACGITDDEAFFAYDSALVRQKDFPILDKLAKCFLDGPLAGRQMRLVGHADPRGDEEYNMTLGDKRAQAVKSYLTGKKLASDKVDTTSRGEMDATGTDESGWFKDRRVDVMLAE